MTFGSDTFDCAISFQTMHHFSAQKKEELYRKVYEALTRSGIYLECDYMVETQEEERFYQTENARQRRALGIREDVFYHYDMPLAIETQKKILGQVGFQTVEQVFRQGNTTMLLAKRCLMVSNAGFPLLTKPCIHAEKTEHWRAFQQWQG